MSVSAGIHPSISPKLHVRGGSRIICRVFRSMSVLSGTGGG